MCIRDRVYLVRDAGAFQGFVDAGYAVFTVHFGYFECFHVFFPSFRIFYFNMVSNVLNIQHTGVFPGGLLHQLLDDGAELVYGLFIAVFDIFYHTGLDVSGQKHFVEAV